MKPKYEFASLKRLICLNKSVTRFIKNQTPQPLFMEV